MKCPQCGKEIIKLLESSLKGYKVFAVHSKDAYRGSRVLFSENQGCFLNDEEIVKLMEQKKEEDTTK